LQRKTHMAVYDLEEQEQLEELKTWWKMHGTRVTAVVVVVALAVGGWQGWKWWQHKQATDAAAVYNVFLQAAAAHDPKRTRELAGELIDKYASTTYASMAALVSAKTQIEAGDSKNAQAQLSWAAEHGGDEALRDIARLRLATVLADSNAADEALKQLAADPAPAFAPRYAELRGDILVSQGKQGEARTEYERALTKVADADKEAGAASADPRRNAYRDMLKAKLESVGGTAK
jgi:predicted negative regulator of RcsB-dependent stress response